MPDRMARMLSVRGTGAPAHPGLLGALLVLTLVAGCRPAEERSAAEVARADQLVAGGDQNGAMAALGHATALNADNVDAWVRLGRLQLQAGDPTSADQSFQRAQELAPDNIEALDNLVILAVRGNELDRAKRYMDTLLVLQPDDPAGLLAQGAVALRERRPAEALAASERILSSYADLAEGALLRARALAALGRRREAIRGLEAWVTAHADQPQRKPVLLLLLDDYRTEGDVAGIRATATRLHEIDPREPRFAIEAARALRAGGQPDRAEEIVGTLIERSPHSAEVARAALGYWRDTLPPAEARARIGALASHADRGVRIALADGLVDLGAPGDALALVTPLAQGAVAAGNADAVAVQVRALAALGRAAAARARVDELLAFDGANVPGLLVRARLLMAARAFDQAIADAQLAQNSDGANEAASALLAQIYVAEGNATLAQQTYALAIQRFPDSYGLLSTYVDWLVANRREAEARRVLGSYARRHRANAAAWRRYGALCTAAGDPCAADGRGSMA